MPANNNADHIISDRGPPKAKSTFERNVCVCFFFLCFFCEFDTMQQLNFTKLFVSKYCTFVIGDANNMS